jgi:hypothetical protein
MTEFRRHQDALVAAGYYEERWVDVPNRTFDARFWKMIYPELMTTAVGRTRYAITFNGKRPHELRVVSTKSEIDEFERILNSLKPVRQDIDVNQILMTNGRPRL